MSCRKLQIDNKLKHESIRHESENNKLKHDKQIDARIQFFKQPLVRHFRNIVEPPPEPYSQTYFAITNYTGSKSE